MYKIGDILYCKKSNIREFDKYEYSTEGQIYTIIDIEEAKFKHGNDMLYHYILKYKNCHNRIYNSIEINEYFELLTERRKRIIEEII